MTISKRNLNIPLSDSMHHVLRKLGDEGHKALVVGGAVRDAMLGEEPKDIDVEVYGTHYDHLSKTLSQHGKVNLVGKAFGVVKFTDPDGNDYDFSLPRRDNKTGVGHKDFTTDFDPDITPKEAASRRDFTFNSMAYDPEQGELHDYYHGEDDLKNKVIRHTSDAFSEDPLRVLRGMQFSARFGMHLHPDTAKECQRISDQYDSIPKERVGEEFMKLATKGKHPGAAIDYLKESGWSKNFPAIHALHGVPQDSSYHPEGDVAAHTGHAMDAAAKIADREGLKGDDRATIVLGAMCHDMGKPVSTQIDGDRITSHGHESAGEPIARQFLSDIDIKPDIANKVAPLVREHMQHLNYTDGISSRTVRRLAQRVAPASIKELGHVMEADNSGRPPQPSNLPVGAKNMLNKAAESHVTDEPMEKFIQGRDVLPYFPGVRPGPHIGEAVKAAYEAQLNGEINSPEEGQEWLKKRFNKTSAKLGMATIPHDQLPDDLRGHIETFKAYPAVQALQQPHKAYYNCGDASQDFYSHMRERGAQSEIWTVKDRLPSGRTHVVNKVGDHFVDWTARQYHEDRDFPDVFEDPKDRRFQRSVKWPDDHLPIKKGPPVPYSDYSAEFWDYKDDADLLNIKHPWWKQSAKLPSMEQLQPYVDTRECTEYAQSIADDFPGLHRNDGAYVHERETEPREMYKDHAWVSAGDGTIIDTTHGQHDPKIPIMVAKPGTKEHARYLRVEDMTDEQRHWTYGNEDGTRPDEPGYKTAGDIRTQIDLDAYDHRKCLYCHKDGHHFTECPEKPWEGQNWWGNGVENPAQPIGWAQKEAQVAHHDVFPLDKCMFIRQLKDPYDPRGRRITCNKSPVAWVAFKGGREPEKDFYDTPKSWGGLCKDHVDSFGGSGKLWERTTTMPSLGPTTSAFRDVADPRGHECGRCGQPVEWLNRGDRKLWIHSDRSFDLKNVYETAAPCDPLKSNSPLAYPQGMPGMTAGLARDINDPRGQACVNCGEDIQNNSGGLWTHTDTRRVLCYMDGAKGAPMPPKQPSGGYHSAWPDTNERGMWEMERKKHGTQKRWPPPYDRPEVPDEGNQACDYGHRAKEVRALPLGGDANALVCKGHFDYEMHWLNKMDDWEHDPRNGEGSKRKRSDEWVGIKWDSLKPYTPDGQTKTASWADVRNKAVRMRNSGRVHIIQMSTDVVVADVDGDHATYRTELWRQYPGQKNITLWDCTCDWNTYAWGTTGPRRKFEGRMCSHALAVLYETLGKERKRGARLRTFDDPRGEDEGECRYCDEPIVRHRYTDQDRAVWTHFWNGKDDSEGYFVGCRQGGAATHAIPKIGGMADPDLHPRDWNDPRGPVKDTCRNCGGEIHLRENEAGQPDWYHLMWDGHTLSQGLYCLGKNPATIAEPKTAVRDPNDPRGPQTAKCANCDGDIEWNDGYGDWLHVGRDPEWGARLCYTGGTAPSATDVQYAKPKTAARAPTQAVIGVGIPGSGKSTFLKPYADKVGAPYLCTDAIRAELNGSEGTYGQGEDEVFDTLYKRMHEALDTHGKVVVDATYTNPEYRRIAIDHLRQKADEVHAIHFDTPLDVAKERNQGRERKVPDDVIERMHQSLQEHPPSEAEGLTSVTRLSEPNHKHADVSFGGDQWQDYTDDPYCKRGEPHNPTAITRVRTIPVPTEQLHSYLGLDTPGLIRSRYNGKYRGGEWDKKIKDVGANGILQPLTLAVNDSTDASHPHVSVIDGTHRIAWAHELGMPTVPCEVRYFGDGVHHDPFSKTAASGDTFKQLVHDFCDRFEKSGDSADYPSPNNLNAARGKALNNMGNLGGSEAKLRRQVFDERGWEEQKPNNPVCPTCGVQGPTGGTIPCDAKKHQRPNDRCPACGRKDFAARLTPEGEECTRCDDSSLVPCPDIANHRTHRDWNDPRGKPEYGGECPVCLSTGRIRCPDCSYQSCDNDWHWCSKCGTSAGSEDWGQRKCPDKKNHKWTVSGFGYLPPKSASRGGKLIFSPRGGRAVTLDVEIAEDARSIKQGLMNRPSMPLNHGMVFLSPNPPARSGFWMMSTLIPLTLITWDRTGRVLELIDMEPCRSGSKCPVYTPQTPYWGAVEVNQGYAARYRISPGDRVELRR